jgi:hypothetical protein
MIVQGTTISIGIEIIGGVSDAIAPPPPIPTFIISESGTLEFLVSENGIDRMITEL